MTEEQRKKKNEYYATYKAKNKDKILARSRKYYWDHKEKDSAYHKLYRKNNKTKYLLAIRRCKLKKDYGITLEEYNNLLKKQNGVCAICGKPPKKENTLLCIDHNHSTKEIRGLLCHNCNLVLGLVYDNKIILENIINYLITGAGTN